MKTPRRAVITVAAAAFVLLQVTVRRHSEQILPSRNGLTGEHRGGRFSSRHLRQATSPSDKPKTLIGIFSTLEDASKTWHRKVFAQYPGRVCSLGDFQSRLSKTERRACQVIYTFVIGASPSGPAEIITSGNGAPKLLVKKSEGNFASDIQSDDCTLLNIKYVL